MNIYISPCLTSKKRFVLGFFPLFLNLAFKDDTHTFLTMSCTFMYFLFFYSEMACKLCSRKTSTNQNLTGVFTFQLKRLYFPQLAKLF